MTRHPFEGTRQYEQIYTNKFGPPMGRPGNGLGDVWGDSGIVEAGDERDAVARSSRPHDTPSFFVAEVVVAKGPDEETVLRLGDAIARLTTRQAFVIGLRYGLRDGVEYGLEEIAALMGVSNQAVSDLERRALVALEKLVEGVGGFASNDG